MVKKINLKRSQETTSLRQTRTEAPKKKKPNMPNHISEYFTKVEGTKEAFHSRELFKASEEDVDIKTDLSIEEIILINKLIFNNEILRKRKLTPIYQNFIYHYMRLKISLGRQSRGEFVSINKGDKTEEATTLLSQLSNITGAKK